MLESSSYFHGHSVNFVVSNHKRVKGWPSSNHIAIKNNQIRSVCILSPLSHERTAIAFASQLMGTQNLPVAHRTDEFTMRFLAASHESFHCISAHLFLRDLAAKTRGGQRGRVKAGKIPGGNSYGYKIVRRILDNGSVSTGEREIDPVQAAIIRRIFQEYADGLAPRRIAGRLNAENIRGPRGVPWNASTINGSRQRRNGILNNELYLGRITYN